jgi:L-ascorbate metabolism protein UlaG (beta-lactamase superfamily)
MNHLIRNIRWLGYEGILINEKPIVYINPYKLAFPDIGDVILFTDNKPDHCSPDDAKWLRKGSTVIAGPAECAERFQGDVRTIKAGDSVSVKGAGIEVFPVYETKENEKIKASGVGLNLKFANGLRVFHPGDTALIPEMQPGMTDVLIIPVKIDDNYRIEEAAAIVNQINPRLSIPINWDGKKESGPMIEEFKKLCNSEVEVLKPKP